MFIKNSAADGIWATDLWYRKRLLCQLSKSYLGSFAWNILQKLYFRQKLKALKLRLSDESHELSVTSKKLPNDYKSCLKMISLEKWQILTPLQNLPKNVGDLGKLIVAKGFKKLPKVQ